MEKQIHKYKHMGSVYEAVLITEQNITNERFWEEFFGEPYVASYRSHNNTVELIDRFKKYCYTLVPGKWVAKDSNGVCNIHEDKRFLKEFIAINEEPRELEKIPAPAFGQKGSYYQLFPDLETIEAIEKLLTMVEFRGFLKGTLLRYRLRAGKKYDATEDLYKSSQYEKKLQEFMARTTGEGK